MDMPFCTPNLLLNTIIFLVGSYILIKGSDIFVDSAAAIARSWHVSELVIGLTLVSIGTSIPELATSIIAQIGADSDFVIGNVAGSNVTNISLILGASLAIGGTMPFQKSLLKRDTLFMNILFIVTIVMFYITPQVPGKNGPVYGLDWIGGIILLIGAGIYSYALLKTTPPEEEEGASDEKISQLKEFALLITGLFMVAGGSKAMVDTVQWGAETLGVSTVIISATIVAFGTSVPELAVTITGVLKKKADMAIGNIVGSCIFNILLIFGAAAVINPLGINSGLPGWITLLGMVPVGLLLLAFMLIGYKKQVLPRWTGFIFLVLYVGFLTFNVMKAI
ncbi:MAG: calcium/sodium antiporter [Lentisphaeria bacterium]|nr:calcium/sodium antiporter [Lentisphaeria bacterium]